MDFLTTAQLLMDMQAKIGPFHYHFDEYNGTLNIELRVADNVPQMFEDAAKMFAPL